nr:hypothetical protein BaRGS_031131 [Batillaria attramentaria]KAG5685552.1 hypothetical protein BaRGS_001975 [Batillaria attramentaria]
MVFRTHFSSSGEGGEHRNPRVASEGYLEPAPRMKSAPTPAQPSTPTESEDTGNSDLGDREVRSGSGGEENEEYQDDYITMGPVRHHNPVHENSA